MDPATSSTPSAPSRQLQVSQCPGLLWLAPSELSSGKHSWTQQLNQQRLRGFKIERTSEVVPCASAIKRFYYVFHTSIWEVIRWSSRSKSHQLGVGSLSPKRTHPFTFPNAPPESNCVSIRMATKNLSRTKKRYRKRSVSSAHLHTSQQMTLDNVLLALQLTGMSHNMPASSTP